ncbi:hypothetical protein D3C81_1609150 [compost metagenome]
MPGAYLLQQGSLHRWRIGPFAGQRGGLSIGLAHLARRQVGRQQWHSLLQGLMHYRPVQLPIPTVLPGQRFGQVCRHGLPLNLVDQRLLFGLQHFQQEAALHALPLQRAQQPKLQRVMVRVVMFLPHQHTGGA